MNSFLYAKLAWQNLRRMGKFYFPYILTIAGTSASFYILTALGGASDLPKLDRYSYLTAFVWLGTIVIGLFAVIFLFYTNSFLMKRRNREIGLYNILGMGKRHIAKVMSFETLYTAVAGIGGGILGGLLFQKLVTLLLYKLMRFDVPYGFYVSYNGIIMTVILFLIILVLNLLYNLHRIKNQNPIELLHASSAGEREAKTRWLLTFVGVLSLGGGYYIAMTTKSAMDAVALYFFAVILVIIGTYCLFTSVSIVVLKLLRNSKKFYYKTKNFIGISGMLYRMKRNAVGLANICILSTMVLVMISGTLALFAGTEDALETRYPADITGTVYYDPLKEEQFQADTMLEHILEGVRKEGRKPEKVKSVNFLEFGAGKTEGVFVTNYSDYSNAEPVYLTFITAEEYARLTGDKLPELADDEIMVYERGAKLNDTFAINFTFGDKINDGECIYKIKSKLDSFPFESDSSTYIVNAYYAVVSDDNVMRELYIKQRDVYTGMSSMMVWRAFIDIDGNSEEKIRCADFLSDYQNIEEDAYIGSWESYRIESRDANRDDIYAINGGFFFLGIFLGLLFIMAAVLIIYYKQISEGYEDRERFQIMQKVGLEKKEIRNSINAQVMVVFFMPLLVSAIHIAFDFRLMVMLLTLFQLHNSTLTLICSVGTLLAFIAVYGIVYMLTARSYYKIVS